LDALLFAMFARLDGFEAMLYNSLEDAPRKKLAGLLRLWVNLLRSGRLITVDIVSYQIIFMPLHIWSMAEHISDKTRTKCTHRLWLGTWYKARTTGYF